MGTCAAEYLNVLINITGYPSLLKVPPSPFSLPFEGAEETLGNQSLRNYLLISYRSTAAY
jgi:hypothetical protein